MENAPSKVEIKQEHTEMTIKNEESRSGVNGGNGDGGSCLEDSSSLAEPSTGTDSGSVDSGDLLGNGGGGEEEFVKEKQLKKPSFVVGLVMLGAPRSPSHWSTTFHPL